MEIALSALAAGAGEIGAGAAAAGAAGVAEAGAGAAASGAGLFSTAGEFGVSISSGGVGSMLSAIGSSPVTSILSGASTAVSVLQKLNAGKMNADNAEFHAAEAKNEAIGAQAQGAQRVTAIKRSLMKTLGENDVAYAASGVDLSYGVAADNRATQRDLASGAINTDTATTSAQVAGYDARAAAYMRMSRAYRTGSMLDALATAGQGIAGALKRG